MNFKLTGFPTLSRPVIHPLGAVLLLSVYISWVLNDSFWSGLQSAVTGTETHRWLVFASWAVVVTAAQLAAASWVMPGRWAFVGGTLFCLVASFASVYATRYGVVYDKTMLRNVFSTHWSEASELLTPGLLGEVFLYCLPWLVFGALVKTAPESGWSFVRSRAVLLLFAAVGVTLIALLQLKDVASLMRNHPKLRHTIVPSSVLTSSLRLGLEKSAPEHLVPLGLDAHLNPGAEGKPVLVVMVVGETARAANWGLSGYARDTTPGLRQHGVLNFPYALACGTNTEVSVPCMFSRLGRHGYDETAIRSSESLLHLLSHAGVSVTWIDNQSGCKGVCKGLKTVEPVMFRNSVFCKTGTCMDEVLVDQLEREIFPQPKNQLIVLHQLGSHGPAYSARYPRDKARFLPDCQNADMGKCTDEEVVNAYDNTVAYTDHVLSRMLDVLKKVKDRPVAFVYVSDHGESLGEHGVYLHGLPYAIAPKEQTQVPFVMWLSGRYHEHLGIKPACVQRLARDAAEHDHLFDTLMGLYGVSSTVYDPKRDLLHDCRS